MSGHPTYASIGASLRVQELQVDIRSTEERSLNN